MCFKRKNKTIQTAERTLIDIINEELSDKETPITFNFTQARSKFYFCGRPYEYSYNYNEIFDFYCAEEQIDRAINLLKSSLISIKNKFAIRNIKNKIVLDKISSLLLLEQDFQSKMKDEEIKHQQKEKSNIILFSSIEMFQSLSREYLKFVLKIKEDLIAYTKKNIVNYDIINSVTLNINELSGILPIELKNYKNNLNGYTIVYNLENFLRVLILIILKRVSLKQMMDKELYTYLLDQKSKEKENKWCDERYGGDLFYLTFSQLVQIIDYNKTKFKQNAIYLTKINNEIDKIATIRNKIAHNNLVSDDDMETLKAYSKNIYKYLDNFSEDIKNYKFNKITKKATK